MEMISLKALLTKKHARAARSLTAAFLVGIICFYSIGGNWAGLLAACAAAVLVFALTQSALKSGASAPSNAAAISRISSMISRRKLVALGKGFGCLIAAQLWGLICVRAGFLAGSTMHKATLLAPYFALVAGAIYFAYSGGSLLVAKADDARLDR
jgi:hypothetical protein